MGYARILKDNNGKPSGYRECDGEVAFMPEQQSYENIFRRVKIDLATMEVLSHDFIKDKERVTKDDERVYFCQVTVKRAIPQSFAVLSDGYACDDKHIFWGNRLVDADFDSFRVMEDGNAEDNYHYFFHGTMIKKKVQR